MKVTCYNLDPLQGSEGEIVPNDLEVGKEYNLCTQFEDNEDYSGYNYYDIGRLLATDKKGEVIEVPLLTKSLETGVEIPESDLVKWYHVQWFTKTKEDKKDAG